MLKKCISECFGTAVLVLFGCGTAVVTGCGVEGGWALTALAFGLSIIALAYVIGKVSGCHVNPAVSLACAIDGRITWKEFLFYVVSQVIGAFVGAGLLMAIVAGHDEFKGLGQNNVDMGVGISFLVEVILTMVFCYTILGVTADEKISSVAGIVIGLTLTFVHILGIKLTGTSVNPARSLAPAILTNSYDGLWVFLTAPFVGSALAAIMYRFVNKED